MKFLKLALFLVLSLCLFEAKAQSSAELKRRRDKITSELEDLRREYEETRNNKRATIKQLNILKAQIGLREEKIKTVNSEIRLLSSQINENSNTVHTLQEQLDQLKKEYAAMIVFAYHNQSAYNKLMFVFASKDFNQAFKRLKYLQQFGTYRERQAASIQGTQKELHVKINELDRTKNAKSNLLQEQQKEKENLGKQRSEQDKVAQDLSKQEGQLKKQQRLKQEQYSQINRQFNRALSREIAEAAKPKAIERKTDTQLLTATPEAAKLSNDFLGNRGRLPWPVGAGQVVQEFGLYRSEGITNDNQGIDIRTGASAPVRAVFEGEVANVVDVAGSYMVIIRHGAYFTGYVNLKSVSVSKGQKVSTRQTLGAAATDPSTGETVVHFEIRNVETPQNPRSWLATQ